MMKPMNNLWRNIRQYNFNSILLRNFVLIVGLIILPLIGISVYVYEHNDANMRAEIERSALGELAIARDSIDMVLSETERLSVRIKSDPDSGLFYQERLSSPLNYSDTVRIQRIQQVLQTARLTSPYIDSIQMFSEYNNFYLTAESGGTFQNADNRWWFNAYEQHNGRSNFWTTGLVTDKTSRTPLLSFVNRISSYEGGKSGGVLIHLNLEKLGNLVDHSVYQRIYVVDPERTIMFHRDSALLNEPLHEAKPELAALLKNGIASRILKLEGQNQVISVLPSLSEKKWAYISVVSLQSYQARRTQITELMIVLLGVSVCSAIVLAFIIATRSYQPIRQILSLIENKENPFWIVGGKSGSKPWNETKYILTNLTESFHQNRSMEVQLQEKYELLRKAQAVALQAQINPHFLYNTLESINWKVMRLTRGKNEASEMIQSLSALLRLTLETKDDLVTIGKELEHLRLYVEMQKLRYKDKFSFRCNVHERLLDCKIVKLVLQPIVENAIYYGIKPSPRNGMITVSVEARRETIVIRVRDNGVGIPFSTAHSLNADLKKDLFKENEHIGLRNVNQRLRLSFGDKYGLTIRSKLKVGTIVEMVIPYIH
ncbi:sensor histidine kinase [Paenibacillus beijingensis]|uniref:Histidine kinase/HSP90-like ATPase domain-containing protein n=1 Tax=Paenibacillus beijingensis TaxID=1126833 RepID=A0A0D5NH28_9BACL|nr:sensor histidine kinase [Paenibacillus beijingensis]AJY74262.1 hypothetical protein VN24_06310 [Paenibacillus beijingensis]